MGTKFVGCAVGNATDLYYIGSQYGSTIVSESSPFSIVSLISSLNSVFLNTGETIEQDETMGE